MLKLYFIIFAIIAIQYSFGQPYNKNEYEEIIPFYFVKNRIDVKRLKNKNIIDLGTINNDSLCMHYNGKKVEEMGVQGVGAIKIDTIINLKERAKKFNVKTGTVYILAIKSETAKRLTADFIGFQLPEGAYLSVFSEDIYNEKEMILRDIWFYTTKNKKHFSAIDKPKVKGGFIGDNCIIIEYFEPKGAPAIKHPIITQIFYSFC